jgi:hypothetical protein
MNWNGSNLRCRGARVNGRRGKPTLLLDEPAPPWDNPLIRQLSQFESMAGSQSSSSNAVFLQFLPGRENTTMSTFMKVLLMAAVPAAVAGIGAYAVMEFSGQENQGAPPLRPLSVNTARKAKGGCCGSDAKVAAKSECCCAAKGKACTCGSSCGSHKTTAVLPAMPTPSASAAQVVGLLSSPMGPLAAPMVYDPTPPPAKVGSAAPAARSTPTP